MRRVQFYVTLGMFWLAVTGLQAQATGEESGRAVDSTGTVMLKDPARDSRISLQGDTLKVRQDPQALREDLTLAYSYDSLWMQELISNQDLFKEMQGMVVDSSDTKLHRLQVPTDTLKARLARLNEQTPLSIEYNPSLEKVINTFLTQKTGLMERMLTASEFYFPMFEEALSKYDIPLELKYLAIVESALNPSARSRVGATGLWQFMYSTGKIYGLEVNNYVDERKDPLKSTEAACRYLSKLYDIFDDWDLALAAYNSGPGNVNKAIRRSGGRRNYWNIRAFLPRETAGYVPAFQTVLYIFNYAEEHGLQKVGVERPYFLTDTVHVKKAMPFDVLADALQMNKEEIQLLNPSYKLDLIPEIGDETFYLRLPLSKIGKYVTNETALYALADKQLEKKEKPLPSLVTQPQRIRYRVRSGDYLGRIAERYGVGVSQIKRWNGLRNSRIRVGQRLTIYPRKFASSQASRSASGSSTAKSTSHLVRSGDSLWKISQKYPGVTVQKLREWNNIRGDKLVPGTRLKLCDCSS